MVISFSGNQTKRWRRGALVQARSWQVQLVSALSTRKSRIRQSCENIDKVRKHHSFSTEETPYCGQNMFPLCRDWLHAFKENEAVLWRKHRNVCSIRGSISQNSIERANDLGKKKQAAVKCLVEVEVEAYTLCKEKLSLVYIAFSKFRAQRNMFYTYVNIQFIVSILLNLCERLFSQFRRAFTDYCKRMSRTILEACFLTSIVDFGVSMTWTNLFLSCLSSPYLNKSQINLTQFKLIPK